MGRAESRQRNELRLESEDDGEDLSPSSTASASSSSSWKWPRWSLDRGSCPIEVFVLDEKHKQGGDWVIAMPKMRVLDDRGNDAYLSAEYCWKGELFDEDFGPDRVRRCGEETTVWELLCSRGGFLSPTGSEGVQGPKMGRVPFDPPRTCQSGAESDHGPQLCDVCMDTPCNSILLPCLHGGLCERCAQRIANNGAAGGSRCPHCRTLIQDVINIGERPQRHAGDFQKAALSWRWPAWCQSQRAGLLEVYVVDAQLKRSEWVTALPQMCVIDGYGEKYLCAEYTWDGERFSEDFGTDRIRRKGDVLTLQQQLQWTAPRL